MRVKNAAVVDGLVSEWCARHTKIEAMEKLQNAGVPAGAVLDTAELTADPHLRKRGMFAPVNHPQRGEILDAGLAGENVGKQRRSQMRADAGSRHGRRPRLVAGSSADEIKEYVKETPLKIAGKH